MHKAHRNGRFLHWLYGVKFNQKDIHNMKKILLSAAAFAVVAVSAVAVAPTTSEAIPAFARQTGAACLSCHFQEVPALNAFGRAFKMNSFTDVGDQALVEDDNLSIPVVMNMSFVVRMDATHTAAAGTSTSVYNIPVDQNLLIAGRAGTNTGVFLEFGGGVGDTNTGGLNNMQVMNSFDVGDFKIGLGYSDTSFGGDAVLITNSVYGQHAGNIGGVGSISAVGNSGWTNSMLSIGSWVGNDMGYIQFSLVAPGGGAGWVNGGFNAGNGGTNVGLKLAKMIKVAATLDVGGFDTIIGAGSVTGKIGKNVAGLAPSMDMQWLFAQMQGDVGDMSVGIYGDWAHAKGKANGNLLGAQDAGTTLASAIGQQVLVNGDKFDAFSLRASIEPIPQVDLALGYGYRKTTSITLANNVKHQIFKIGASYSVYQNMILSLSYENDKATTTGLPATNTKTTVLDYVLYL